MTRYSIYLAVAAIMLLCVSITVIAKERDTLVTDISRESLTPPDATFDSLFETALEHRDRGNLSAGVAVAYLALGKIEKDTERGADRARIHVLISQLLDQLGYRALERIHARAALRESGAQGAPKRSIYQRYAEVLARSLDYELADFYLRHAFRQFQEDTAVEPQPPAAAIELLLSSASLELARANLQLSLEPAALDHLRRAEQQVDEAEAMIDGAVEDPYAASIVALRAQMLMGLSAHLPDNQETIRLEALSTAEKMLSEFIAARGLASDARGDKILRMRNLRLRTLLQLARHDEAGQVIERILDETETRQRNDSDIALNMAIGAAHRKSSELLLSLCQIVMRGEAARADEIARMSGEAVALASIQELRRRSMACLSLISRFAESDAAAAATLLEISEQRRSAVGRAEAEFWRVLNDQPDVDLAKARQQLLTLRSQLSMRIDQGRHDGVWNLIDRLQSGEEILSVEPWWRDFRTSDKAEPQRRGMKAFAEQLIDGSLPWDAVSDVEDLQDEELASLAGLTERLGEKSALVEYIRIDEFDVDRIVFRNRAEYWAIVVRSMPRRINAVKLGDAMKIEADVRDALDLFSDPARDPLDTLPQIDWMKKLHARLWKPLEAHLDEAERVHIVPDGALSLVPFSALSAEGGHFLIERLTLSLHGNTASIAGADLQGNKNNGRIAVLVDPEYGAPVEGGANHRAFKSLKHGPTEARHIREIMGTTVDVYSGADATETRTRTLVSPRILHLATHGSYDVLPAEPVAPESATLDTIARTSNYARYVKRLTRSGVALSGANLLQKDGIDDGWLTAYDVIGINLSNTELVMISACKAGQGARESGEGLMSIARSFSIAGAGHIVATLWPLSDAEAPRQIRSFYRFYSRNADPVAALRAMQLERLKWYRRAMGSEAPPAIWASYMVQRG
jgi:CHAT domain-containing protein